MDNKLSCLREQFASLRNRIQHLMSVNHHLRQKYKDVFEIEVPPDEAIEDSDDSLNYRIKFLESLMELERKWHRSAIRYQDKEIQQLREDSQKLLFDCQDLLGIKVALDLENAGSDDSLNNRVKYLETLLKQEREWRRSTMLDKDTELKVLGAQSQKQLSEYMDLLMENVPQDMEGSRRV